VKDDLIDQRQPEGNVAKLGAAVWIQVDEVRHAASVIGTVLGIGLWPWTWSRLVRRAFARQVVAVGVEPLLFVAVVAVFIGISVVVQMTFWTGEAGLTQLLGPSLVTVVARELGPLLINLIVIVRSGSAMTTELGMLRIKDSPPVLSELDPLSHLVLPRILGMAVATFCLTVVFILIAFISGFFFAAATGKGGGDILLFAEGISRALQPKDVLNILAKSVLPALFAGASCCISGFGVGHSMADIPAATRQALTRSMGGLFFISAVVSYLTYW